MQREKSCLIGYMINIREDYEKVLHAQLMHIITVTPGLGHRKIIAMWGKCFLFQQAASWN